MKRIRLSIHHGLSFSLCVRFTDTAYNRLLNGLVKEITCKFNYLHSNVCYLTKVSKSKSMRRWVISRAGVTDSGTYTCSARNSAGVAATNTALVVTVVDEKQATPQPLQVSDFIWMAK